MERGKVERPNSETLFSAAAADAVLAFNSDDTSDCNRLEQQQQQHLMLSWRRRQRRPVLPGDISATVEMRKKRREQRVHLFLKCWLVMLSKCPAPVPSFHFSPLSPSPLSAWALTWASTPAAPNHISFRSSLWVCDFFFFSDGALNLIKFKL